MNKRGEVGEAMEWIVGTFVIVLFSIVLIIVLTLFLGNNPVKPMQVKGGFSDLVFRDDVVRLLETKVDGESFFNYLNEVELKEEGAVQREVLGIWRERILEINKKISLYPSSGENKLYLLGFAFGEGIEETYSEDYSDGISSIKLFKEYLLHVVAKSYEEEDGSQEIGTRFVTPLAAFIPIDSGNFFKVPKGGIASELYSWQEDDSSYPLDQPVIYSIPIRWIGQGKNKYLVLFFSEVKDE